MPQETIRIALIRGISGTFFLKVLNAGLLFAIGVILARLLGPKEYGIYAYSLTIATFVALPVSKGWPQLLVRQVAIYKSLEKWALLRGLLRWSRFSTILLSLILIGMSLLVFYGIPQLSEAGYRTTLPFALIIVGLLPLLQLNEATIRGFGNPVKGIVSSQTIRPLLFLVFIGLGHWVISIEFDAELGMILQVSAFAGALMTSGLLLSGLTPDSVKTSLAQFDTKPWIKSVLPLLCVGGMQVINNRVDLLMLGAIQGPTEAGIYHAAIRCAELVIFGMMAINVTFAPMVAKLYARQEMQLLQQLVLRCTKGMVAFALPVSVLLILFSKEVLYVFGPGFVQGSPALIVLSLGQLLVAGFGPVGVILNMSGHERVTATWVGITAGCNVILNLTLIPYFGMIGASLATTFSLLMRNASLAQQISKKLSLRTTFFNV